MDELKELQLKAMQLKQALIDRPNSPICCQKWQALANNFERQAEILNNQIINLKRQIK